MSLLYVDDIRGKTAAASVDLSNATNLKLPAGHLNNYNMTRHTAKSVITSTNWTTIYSVTITPKFSTSKILVSVGFSGSHRNHHSGLVRVYRTISGGTATPIGGGLDSQDVNTQWSNCWFNIRKEHSTLVHAYSVHNYMSAYQDSPSTTSLCTYQVKGLTTGDSEGLYVNRTGQNTQGYDSSTGSTISVQELFQ